MCAVQLMLVRCVRSCANGLCILMTLSFLLSFRSELVSLESIEQIYKKRKHDKASRMETVIVSSVIRIEILHDNNIQCSCVRRQKNRCISPVFIAKQTDIHTNGQSDTQTDSQKPRQTDRPSIRKTGNQISLSPSHKHIRNVN